MTSCDGTASDTTAGGSADAPCTTTAPALGACTKDVADEARYLDFVSTVLGTPTPYAVGSAPLEPCLREAVEWAARTDLPKPGEHVRQQSWP